MRKILIYILVLSILIGTASAATLQVGPKEKYHTIQSAVAAAHDGDTIKVAYGTYKENVRFLKGLTFLGTNYPKVDGFDCQGPGKTINGFSIQKDGISCSYSGGGTIRNNYFKNCGISIAGGAASNTIMNNQIQNGAIYLYDTGDMLITGNTISNSKIGLVFDEVKQIPHVTKNTFQNNKYAVFFYGWDHDPGKLTTFSLNVYKNNKVNFGWGMTLPK